MRIQDGPLPRAPVHSFPLPKAKSAEQIRQGIAEGGGASGRLIADFDWSCTKLGPIESWPTYLLTAVNMVVRAPSAMVLLCGKEGVMLYNDAYAAIAGQRHPAILGGRAVDAFPEIAEFNQHVLDVCLSGGVLSFKDRRITLNRGPAPEEIWLDLSYSPVFNEDGQPAAVMAVVIDTTERNMADERLRIAQEAGRFGAFEWFPNKKRLVVSDVYRQIFGLLPEQEVTEQVMLALVLPEDRALTGILRFGKSGNPLAHVEYRIRHGVTGAIRWIARRGEILAASGSALPRYIGVAWDITERKRAELQDAFLASLGQQLQDVGDPMRVIAIAAKMLGEYLGVQRVGYGEMNDEGTHLVVIHGWDDGTVPPFAGSFRIDAFGGHNLRTVRAGVVLRQDDVAAVPELSAPEVQAAHARIDMRSSLAVPLMRDGDFAGVLFAHCKHVRHWEDRDEAIMHAVVGRTWDAVQRARAEQRLRQSEETFRLFAQAVPNQVWAAAPNGQVTWFNDRVYAYCGAAPGTLHGDVWSEYLHPDDRAVIIAAWQTAMQEGKVYEQEFRIRRADGAYRWHIARALPIRDQTGNITRWIGTSTDIEEQRQALAEFARLNTTLEERVAERTRERDRLWTLSRDPLLIADMAGTWLSVSPAWTTLLGWRQAELVGRTAAWMAHPDDPPLLLCDPRTVTGITENPPERSESRFRARDGSYFWFSWTAVAEDGLLYCVARDVTAEKAAAERLRQAEEALRQSQKMEAIGQLTGGIAHDFNNLLTGIQGTLELVRRRISTGRTEDLDRFMAAAMTSSQRAAALTQRLLAFARRQSLDTKSVCVTELVGGMAELLGRTLGEQIKLHISVPSNTWHALTDPNQLENALLNLAINARDAMPEGGHLTIETANLSLDRRSAEMDPALEPGDYVVIAVTDTGLGMPKSVLEKVFEPFFTTKPVGQGTGLGLSMVYGFIRQCGGNVHIYSEPGLGTTVKLSLKRAPRADERPAPNPTDVPTGAGETVLVVEDDPAVRMLVLAVLQELGYKTLEASDAASALPILASAPSIDLMISDVGLPGLNGRQIADYARVRMPGLRVLFITGYAEQAASRSGFLAPGMAMITKPFAIETLAEKIREIMATPMPVQEI